jgi:glycosyltransferase involved in cell wall biosynthesis
MGSPVSVVVAVRDEAEMIDGCLRRLAWADEVLVVVDDRTQDDTAARAAAAGATVIHEHFSSFAEFKNAGIASCRNEWVLVVDADERVTADLAREIESALHADSDAFRVPIRNYFFGGEMRHGGWTSEHPVRLFRRGARYHGDIHETLDLAGVRVGDLAAPLLHFSHRSIGQNVAKTRHYADIQAAEMLAAGHPKVTRWMLTKTVVGEFVRRMVLRQGWRDGMPGFIEGVYQPFSLFVVYVRLWELQQQTPLPEQYRNLDATVT